MEALLTLLSLSYKKIPYLFVLFLGTSNGDMLRDMCGPLKPGVSTIFKFFVSFDTICVTLRFDHIMVFTTGSDCCYHYANK